MKKSLPYIHPMNLHASKIKERGIVVFDDVRQLPSGNQPFVSPHYVIAIGHRGRIDLTYDGTPDFSEQHTVGVIFPNHVIQQVSKTDDYLATLIVVDVSVLNDPMLQIINRKRYRHELHPNVKLDKHEYKMMMNVVEGMREITRLKMSGHRMLMARLLEFFIRLLSHYRIQKLNEPQIEKRVSERFQQDLKEHFRNHRDVAFYAGRNFLSTKYFSSIIKQETGHPAAYWIHHQLVAEAKMLLHVRRDLPIQAISDMLGFDEQATFSRYFHRETGMSPSQFRNSD